MTRQQAITQHIKGIQCDNPECDWKNLEAEFKPEKWLNEPCPKCGSNLFTEEAYAQLKFMQGMINEINKTVSNMGVDLSKEERVKLELLHDEGGLINSVRVKYND